jgi:outer membrane protein
MENWKEETVKDRETEQRRRKITYIALGLIVVAVAGLYVLHFTGGGDASFHPAKSLGDSTGILVLTVNNDSITDTNKYELARIRLSELSAERAKYQQEITQKSTVFQQKLNNYLINKQSGVLTQGQMEKTERELTAEQEALESLDARYSEVMNLKQLNVLQEIRDSIINAANRVNARRYGADYIFASGQASVIVHANPVYDVTQEVLEEMNSAYKASEK